MTMKVQGSSAAAVQTTQNTQSAQSSQSSQPSTSARTSEAPGSARARPDDLSRLPRPDFDKHLGWKPAGLDWGDRFTAADLHKSLSNPLNDRLLQAGQKSETITRDQNGIYRGPNGQPLVPVRLDDGNTAYVDPNTNRYYLTNEQPGKDGSVRALPAIDLPKDAQFSNRYFNDQDARDLTQIAQDHSIFPHRPQPLPWPDRPAPSPFPPSVRPQPEPLPCPDRPFPPSVRPPPDPFPGTPRLDLPDDWLKPLRNRNIAV